jgi:predicted transcriptional regulator
MKRVLISIKPEHADNILSGTKTVELRKLPFPDCNRIVMYCTSPVKRLVGEFKVEAVTTMSKETLWLMYGPRTGITKEQFDAYYKGRHWAAAILIKDVCPWPNIDPPRVFGKFHAPMSWRYLSVDEWLRIHVALEGKK